MASLLLVAMPGDPSSFLLVEEIRRFVFDMLALWGSTALGRRNQPFSQLPSIAGNESPACAGALVPVKIRWNLRTSRGLCGSLSRAAG